MGLLFFFNLICCLSLQPIPSALYSDLFIDVQLQNIFGDEKTFCDLIPLESPSSIMKEYHSTHLPLLAFVNKSFAEHQEKIIDVPQNQTLLEHIQFLWPRLTRSTPDSNSSLVPLPNPYVVPGGRFAEAYYWDEFFIMLGLKSNPKYSHLVEGMLWNFAHLLDSFGRIPNGNRNYFLSRSQPPFFSLMVEKFSDPRLFYPQLLKEYQFWKEDRTSIMPGENISSFLRSFFLFFLSF